RRARAARGVRAAPSPRARASRRRPRAMLNALTAAGVLLLATGAVVVLLGVLGALGGMVRRAQFRRKPIPGEDGGIYSGAVTAQEVYVPGTIVRKLGMALGGVAVGALGVPFLLGGLELAKLWIPVGD